MHKIEVRVRGQKIVRMLPQTWQELNRWQLQEFAKLTASKELDEEELRDAITIQLLNIAWEYLKHMKRFQLNSINEKLRFLFKEEMVIEKNLFPSMRCGLHVYHGPDDEMMNISVEELVRLDSANDAYCDSKNEKHLWEMIATVYRPTNLFIRIARMFNGMELRETTLNDVTIQRRVARIKKMNPVMREAVKLNVMGMHANLRIKFPLIYKKKETSSGGGNGWMGIIDNLAGPKYGTDEDVQRKSAWNMLTIMTMHEADQQRKKNIQLPKTETATFE
jgi:hypothetical protein